MRQTVTIVERGREGTVTYTEGGQSIAGYWEFGGGDVVAIVGMGTVADWQARHPWAVERRARILRFIGAELVRQRAPSCRVDVDDARGDILLRSSAAAVASASGAAAVAGVAAASGEHASGGSAPVDAGHHDAPSAPGDARGRPAWLWRAAVALVLCLAVGGWVAGKLLVIDPGKGTPVAPTARTGTHFATLIATLEAYTPSLHRDGSRDRYTLSVFLVPLDGAAPKRIRLAEGLTPGAFSLAKVIGSDGRTLWLDAAGLVGVDLADHAVRKPAALRRANPSLDPMLTEDTRGMEIVDGRLRLLARDRSMAFTIDPDTLRATPVRPTPPAARLPALSPVDLSRPTRLVLPDGALVLQPSASGPMGTVAVSRVDPAGGSLWATAIPIDRFKLQQVLPGERSTAFVGTRVPVPGKVSEPLLVIVDHATGRQVQHSLWQ